MRANLILSRMTDRERSILILSLAGLPDRQIAHAINSSPDAIKQGRLRGLRRLVGEYQDEMDEQKL